MLRVHPHYFEILKTAMATYTDAMICMTETKRDALLLCISLCKQDSIPQDAKTKYIHQVLFKRGNKSKPKCHFIHPLAYFDGCKASTG